MLFWISILVFGFSIYSIIVASKKKKLERENQLKSIRKKIEANEAAKSKAHKKSAL